MMQSLRSSENKERVKYLLQLFKLDPSGETKKMSLGDKRKLAIVAAFMDDPAVLVLDEPTSGLDPVMQQVFINLVKEEKKRGKTVLLSSHIFSEVEATCDRISIIKDGRIVSTFETNAIKHNENKNYEVVFKNLKDLEDMCGKLPKIRKNTIKIKQNAIRTVDKTSRTVIVAVNDKDINSLVSLLSQYDIAKFTQVKFTLQDYFMRFYREDKNFGGIF